MPATHSMEKVSSNQVKLSFKVDYPTFADAVQKAYLKNRGRINIPGFRKGKAPLVLIQRMYGEGIFYEDAMDILFPKMYEDAVKEYDLQTVDRPSLDMDEVVAGQDITFTVLVYVRPDVTLGEYKNLEVTYTPFVTPEGEVDRRIEADRQRVSRNVEVTDRPVENGDTVILDYAGTVDGVAFAGGTAEKQTLKIGANAFIPGFEEQMIGMEIGEEKDLNVTFPEQYHSQELAGKAAVFHVKVHDISRVELPELDDEFAGDVSEFDTFAEYKANIEKTVAEEAEQQNKDAIENALLEKAVDNAAVDIPHAMIDDQVTYLLRDMQMRMAYQGLRFEDFLKYTNQTVDQLRHQYHPEAERRVKLELVLDAIVKAEKIEPTDEEVKEQIEAQAKRMNQEPEAFEKTLADAQRGYLRESAAIKKALELMRTTSKATPKVPEAGEDAPAEAAAEEVPRKEAKKAGRPKKTKEEA